MFTAFSFLWLPLPGRILESILAEPAVNRSSVEAIDHQPVLKLLHFFQCINAFVRVAFQDFKQPIHNGWQGIVLAQGQKALRSPTIFRWGCSRTSKTDRIGRMWVAGLLRLNADIVLSQIAKVVFIPEAFRVAEVEIR